MDGWIPKYSDIFYHREIKHQKLGNLTIQGTMVSKFTKMNFGLLFQK